MTHNPIEVTYPTSFREEDTEVLSHLLKNRRSVVLVGMKRVGISNFLRFFLSHAFQDQKLKSFELYIAVDLNDLVERELFPFWILTLKRISDIVEEKIENPAIKKKVSQLFLDSIQSHDVFITIDCIKKSLQMLIDEGYIPTVFFMRFDRITEAATPSFFANFQGLLDATHGKLAYVFTSFRPLDHLAPTIITKHALSVFTETIYLKPSQKKDSTIILNTFMKDSNLIFSDEVQKELMSLVDGYNQYLQYALIILKEKNEKEPKKLFDLLFSDERIGLQSEELWESLTEGEKKVLEKIVLKKNVTVDDEKEASYLFNSGFLNEKKQLFSVLFEEYIKEKIKSKKDNHALELSKKEHMLLTFLEGKINDVCEREEIIEYVWPEAESLGVSDWAIDRLVSRLRNKLKQQNTGFEIVTIKTRGYKLIPENN